MDIYQAIAIALYLLLLLGIGFNSYKKANNSSDEFLLGGRSLGPLVTALSAGAADMSGWLLMGLPGAMYVSGISASWIAIGLTTGAFINYVLIAPRLRVYTERADNAITIPDFFEKRFHDKTHVLRLISAVTILVFFTLYTSAGMVSGGRLFGMAFDMPYSYGLYLTSTVVVLYTFMGGFLAVSTTDLVQGTIMVLALLIVPIVVIFNVGGPISAVELIDGRDPKLLNLFQGTTAVGIFSLLAWGLGYFGQPHILARFMAIEKVRDLKAARRIGISWMILTVGGALVIGLVGISYMEYHNQTIADPETIFIYFSKMLFHPFIGGILLSAILAAVMSTIASQLLVTSSSMTEDFYKAFLKKDATDKQMVFVSRASVLIVAVISLLLSLNPQDTILDLVGHAWAGFGSAFGPLVLMSLIWKRTTKNAGIAGMLVGGLTVLFWITVAHPFQEVYAMIPGFFLSLIAIVVVSLLDKEPTKEIQDEFDAVQQDLKENY